MSNGQENQIRYIRPDGNEGSAKEFTYNENSQTLKVSNLEIVNPLNSSAIPNNIIGIKTVTLTANQVKALNTTPIEIIPTPGAGFAIKVESIVASIDYGTVAFATNTTLEFKYTNGSGAKVSADIASLLNATSDKIQSVGGIEAETTLTENAKIVATVATGNPTDGNSTVKISASYRIITL